MDDLARFGLTKQVETETLAFSASTAVQHEFAKAGYITHIGLLFEITYTVASGGITPAEDDIARVISSMVLRDAGTRRFYEVSDGRQAYYDAYIMYGGNVRKDALGTTAGTTYTRYMYIPLHFGLKPTDVFDTGVVVPELRYGNIYLDLTWAAATALGSGSTISTASKLTMIVHRLILKPGTTEADIWEFGVPTPRSVALKQNTNSVSSDLTFTYDVLTEDVIRSSTLLFLNSSGNRSDADVSELGVVFPNIRMIPYKSTIEHAKSELMAEKQVFHVQTAGGTARSGLAFINWAEISRDPLGLDVSVYDKGNVQIGLTTLLSTGSWQAHHRYVVPGVTY